MFLFRRFIPRTPLRGPRPLSGPAGGPDRASTPPPVPARDDAYRQLENLDFMTAAKILFTEAPKKKQFGFDFHLVQFFFACMPSLAVFLVAQYARYEIRRMEAEVEQKKKKAEEEEKMKEAELGSVDDGSITELSEGSNTELSEVKIRLEALEEVVKEIVDEKNKVSSTGSPKVQEDSNGEQVATSSKNSSPHTRSNSGDSTMQTSKETENASSTLPQIVARNDEIDRKVGNKETSGQKK